MSFQLTLLQQNNNIKILLEAEAWDRLPDALKQRHSIITDYINSIPDAEERRILLQTLQSDNDIQLSIINSLHKECQQRLQELERRGQIVNAYQANVSKGEVR